MAKIWMAVHPGAEVTRVIAIDTGETILKARLSAMPKHPRAFQWLLEAVALWQGRRVSAALCADGKATGRETGFYQDWFADFGGPLYGVEWVEHDPRRRCRTHDRVGSVGTYRDLKQLHLRMLLERS